MRRIIESLRLSACTKSWFPIYAIRSEPLYTKPDERGQKIWRKVNSEGQGNSLQVLQISHDIRMVDEPFQKRVRFWEGLERKHKL